MKKTVKKTLKISAVAFLFVFFVGVICYSLFFVGAKSNNSTKLNEELQSSEFYGSFETLNPDNNSDFNKSIIGSQAGGNSMSLADVDVSKLGNEGIDYVVIVAFVNLYNGPTTWNQNSINKIMQSLNDDDSTNDIYSVREYFKEQTYGKLRFKAWYTEYDSRYGYDAVENKSSSGFFHTEEILYTEALRNATEFKDENGNVASAGDISQFHCRFIYYPYDSNEWLTILWPHSWHNQAFISSPQVLTNGSTRLESPFMATYAHEFSHVLGIKDLYSYEGDENQVGMWDLMSSHDKYNPQSISAYFKSQLGLTGESAYGYKDDSKVKVVSSSGDYTLAPTSSQTGTIALKFAERTITVTGTCSYNSCPKHYNNSSSYSETGKEMFFVEYKKKTDSPTKSDYCLPQSGLIIYRVVESYHTLMLGNSYSSMLGNAKYQIYVLRPNDAKSLNYAAITEGQTFGSFDDNSNTTITYHDGTNTQISITNNGHDNNGNVKLKFTFPENHENFSISGTFMIDLKPVSNAKVMISIPNADGTYSTPIYSGVNTDEDGYFFVTGLKEKTKLSFELVGSSHSTLTSLYNSPTIKETSLFNVFVVGFTFKLPDCKTLDLMLQSAFKKFLY